MIQDSGNEKKQFPEYSLQTILGNNGCRFGKSDLRFRKAEIGEWGIRNVMSLSILKSTCQAGVVSS